MLSAMLVDDEILSLRMLESIIDWHRFGIELVAMAQDGNSAWQLFLKHRPNLILTDIRMPGMDGLTFLRRVKELEPGTEIILVSAYADFEYAKEAISLGGANYLLKPVDEYELEQTLRRLCDKINLHQSNERLLKDSRRQKEIRALYNYMRWGKGAEMAQQSAAVLRLEFSSYALFSVALSESTMDAYTENQLQLSTQLPYIQGRFTQALEGWGTPQLFDFEGGGWTVILTNPKKQLAGCAEALLGVLGELGLEGHVCFTETASQIQSQPSQFALLTNLHRYNFFLGEDPILGYGYNCAKQDFDRMSLLDLGKTLSAAAEQGNQDRVREAFQEGFRLAGEIGPNELHLLYEFCYNGLRAVREGLRSAGIADKGVAADLRDVEKCATLEELQELAFRTVDLLGGATTQEKRYSDMVSSGISYLQANYNRNLTLDEICAQLSVSKSYFCYIFKKETETNIWAYLTELRLKRAAELLSNTEEKTYTIAYQVGYDNPSYFSKLFKKSTGKTPNEFRQELQKR